MLWHSLLHSYDVCHLFNGVDLAVIFPSTLAPVIITAVMPLITLVAVVAGVVALVAAVKIVVPTTVAMVVVVVWWVVRAWNPCASLRNTGRTRAVAHLSVLESVADRICFPVARKLQ